jgi:hypothetical protein
MKYKHKLTNAVVQAVKFEYSSECLDSLAKLTIGFDDFIGEHGRYVSEKEEPWVELYSSSLQAKVLAYVGDYFVKFPNKTFEPFTAEEFNATFKRIK